MARKPKKPEAEFPAPLNMSDDLADMTVVTAGTMRVADTGVGVLTILTPVGHFDFVVSDETADEIIQALRELLRGDSENLLK